MFTVALAFRAAASPWIDVRAVPQNLIEGVISTFIGLAILFSIKPRLEIELLPVRPRVRDRTSDTPVDPRSETFKFKVTNRRWRKVAEVKVRLWKVSKVGSREPINLVIDELFELRGKLSPIKPTLRVLLSAYRRQLSLNESCQQDAKADIESCHRAREANKRVRARYTFYPECGKLEEEKDGLRQGDFILFQVIAKDAFTGFIRLKAVRFYENDLEEVARQAATLRQGSPAASGHSPMAGL